MFLEDKRDGELLPQVKRSPLATFIALLKDRGQWPEGFVWDYNKHESCAIGLARRLGLVRFPMSSAMAVAFGLPPRAAWLIFIAGNRNWFGWSRTKPRQIARALEKLGAV